MLCVALYENLMLSFFTWNLNLLAQNLLLICWCNWPLCSKLYDKFNLQRTCNNEIWTYCYVTTSPISKCTLHMQKLFLFWPNRHVRSILCLWAMAIVEKEIVIARRGSARTNFFTLTWSFRPKCVLRDMKTVFWVQGLFWLLYIPLNVKDTAKMQSFGCAFTCMQMHINRLCCRFHFTITLFKPVN